MKFRVDHDVLADAVGWVARALPSRPVMPVLSGLRLEAGAGLTLSCFDYEIAATASVEAEVAEHGTALVPGRLLAEIIRSLPAQPAEVSSDSDAVNLTCGSAEFSLVSLPLAEYPALPAPPPLAGTVDGGDLAAAVAQVLPAASRDDTLPMLTAICLDIDGGVMTLAATDRYRMAVRRVPWSPRSPGLRAVVLVPARTMADAVRAMTPGLAVSVCFEHDPARPGGREAGAGATPAGPAPADGMISFASGGRRLTGRLIGGEFIRYESRFPREFGCRAEIPAASFTEAVRRVSLVADRASPVRLTFGGGRVMIEAHAQGRARAAEAVTASFHGDEPSIAFNPQYLLDGLVAAGGPAAGRSTGEAARTGGEAVPGGDPPGDGAAPAGRPAIRLEFTSQAKPALITSATDPGDGEPAGGHGRAQPSVPPPAFRYLVVPLRPAGG